MANQRGEPLRVLVVGASSGIGAATAATLVGRVPAWPAAARRAAPLGRARRGDPGDLRRRGRLRLRPCGRGGCFGHRGTGRSRLRSRHDRADTARLRPDRERWTEIFTTNMFGAAMISRAALPHLRSAESDGRAVFLTSDSAVKPYPGLVAYGASKAALERLLPGAGQRVPRSPGHRGRGRTHRGHRGRRALRSGGVLWLVHPLVR